MANRFAKSNPLDDFSALISPQPEPTHEDTQPHTHTPTQPKKKKNLPPAPEKRDTRVQLVFTKSLKKRASEYCKDHYTSLNDVVFHLIDDFLTEQDY